MKILIIEDEALAATKLENLLIEYDENIHVQAILTSVAASVEWLSSHEHPDLLLLDIHLADGLCFEIFRQVEVKCPVIFTTAYDQYALDAFQVYSIDYLLKPIQYAKLAQSLDKMQAIHQTFQSVSQTIRMDDIMNMIRQKEATYKSRFMVKIGTKIRTVKVDEIAYFYSNNKLILLVTKEGQSFPVDYALDELIRMLNPNLFFHINRKLIIHIDSAKEIRPYFKGRLKLVLHPMLDEEIIISSQKTPLFKTWLDH